MMKEIEEHEIEKEISSLVEKFYSENGKERKEAREELVKIGRPAIDYLEELEHSDEQIVRWEAIKTLSEIADPIATPIFVNALEDDDSEIRWLAAEGIINIGQPALEELFVALINNPDSMELRKGAHHVLRKLIEQNRYKDYYGIQEKLYGNPKESGISPVAEAALKILKHRKV